MMKRRFGRGRKTNPGRPKGAPIDAARCFERIAAERIVSANSLSPVTSEEIPEHFAAVAVGESERGGQLVVAFAPRNGADAALAGLVHATSLGGDSGFDGEVVAVCPQWSISARRRLGLLAPQGVDFRALVASSLADDGSAAEVSPVAEVFSVPARQVADRVEGSVRDLFIRALAALEGLAAKHGGAVRGVGSSVELVLLAGRVASIRVEEPASSQSRLVLETLQPEKATERLDSGNLAVAMDRLEGSLRKRLNDRRMRAGEEGLRAQLLGSLIAAEGVRASARWPLAGSEPELIDFVGVGAGGASVVGALRSKIALPELAAILDGVAAVRPLLAAWLAEADAPVRLDAIRLLLAASEFSPGALALLPMLSLDHASYDIEQPRGRDPELRLRGSGVAGRVARRDALAAESGRSEAPAEANAGQSERSAGRRRRRGQRGSAPREARELREPREIGDSAEPTRNRYDEVSIFDLDDASDTDAGARRSRRGRRRGRRPRSDAADSGSSAERSESRSDAPGIEASDSEGGTRSARGRERGRGGKRAALGARDRDDLPDDDADDDLADLLIPQIADVEEPTLDPELVYDDTGESELASEAETAEATAVAEAEAKGESAPRRPRRRAAFVVHADRRSLIAALLLARDVRLVEGIWVYPQTELMTFFRSVATDLHEQTPIYVIGFTASPARDTIQAAALYADRIDWFDHHDWPPEDLESLREAIGEQRVIVMPGVESAIPTVLTQRSRRSRFSDKIVELANGRFSQHDYERWGRVWWERLGAAAAKYGERRADIEPLLIGRPSDLASEAAEATTPPPPPEVEFVASRDFRLVHFGGYCMTVVPTPPEFDMHLAARIARERYGSQLSLAFTEGEEVAVLAGDEGSSGRNLDLMAMASHVATKHDWIDAPPSEDYVARIHIRDLVAHPDRLNEVIGEIAMGRSILEG